MDGKCSTWELWYLDMMMATTRPIRYNASFVACNSYIVKIGCLIIWATVLKRVAKEELAYVQRLGLK
jgi:hypothetical protein